MPTQVDFSALSMGHEQLVLREPGVELPKAPANASAGVRFPVLLEDGAVVGTLEGVLQV